MPSSTSSSRWCPTPEQLMILEEMYKGGTRTPNAAEIQKITARLSRYGKIEGKNVFYWFQNHKARDRQRLRRKLMSSHFINHQQFQSPNPLFPMGLLSLPPLTYYSPLGLLPQGCTGVETVTTMGNSLSRMYGDDCMIMLDVGTTTTTPAAYGNRPLKTLQLFPITATGLNEEKTVSKQNSCSTLMR